jgi:hypothetical protein
LLNEIDTTQKNIWAKLDLAQSANMQQLFGFWKFENAAAATASTF